MTDAIIYAPRKPVEARYLAAAHASGFKLQCATTEASVTDLLSRDAESFGIIWATPKYGVSYVAKLRAAGVQNHVVVMLHMDGDPAKLALARAAILMAGADDCQPSTIDIEELTARLKSMIWRTRDFTNPTHEFCGCSFDPASGEVWNATGTVTLTRYEAGILDLIVSRNGQVVTKEMIFLHLYNGMTGPGLKVIDVFVCKVRAKISQILGDRDVIETTWGRGFRFVREGYVPERMLTRARFA